MSIKAKHFKRISITAEKPSIEMDGQEVGGQNLAIRENVGKIEICHIGTGVVVMTLESHVARHKAGGADFEEFVDADISLAAEIAGSKIHPDVTNALVGFVAGKKIAFGHDVALSGATIKTVATGHTTVDVVVAVEGTEAVTAGSKILANKSVTAGSIELSAKGAIGTTLVHWIAIGT